MTKYIKTSKYDKSFIDENMMGPNAMVILEELVENIPLKKGMRVLDLGCGRVLTSIFLAKEYGVQVFAVDLWIPASENYKLIKEMGLEDLVIPIHSDANELPFAEDYFDAVISVDSYYYFGNNDTYFKEKLKPLLKKDAIVAIAFPGIVNEIEGNVPKEMEPFWNEEVISTFHSIPWWTKKFEHELNNFSIFEMDCFEQAWNDWLSTDNSYAIEDRPMLKANDGKYMNIIGFTGRNN